MRYSTTDHKNDYFQLCILQINLLHCLIFNQHKCGGKKLFLKELED